MGWQWFCKQEAEKSITAVLLFMLKEEKHKNHSQHLDVVYRDSPTNRESDAAAEGPKLSRKSTCYILI